MTNNPLEGLDMKATLEWYAQLDVPDILGQKREFSHLIENPELIELSPDQLGGLYDLFPQEALDRSILQKVIGVPETWFSNESTQEKPLTTTNPDEALTDTSFVPSYIDYSSWQKTGVPGADIWLYKIPETAADINVRRIVLTEGFLHELGHSVVQPALYGGDNYNLKFPDGRIVNGREAMIEFAELSEKHPAISHYASTYRSPTGKFEGPAALTAISEEMCETVAAYFLGFAYCSDETRALNPFADRPEVKDFVENFLNARRD